MAQFPVIFLDDVVQESGRTRKVRLRLIRDPNPPILFYYLTTFLYHHNQTDVSTTFGVIVKYFQNGGEDHQFRVYMVCIQVLWYSTMINFGFICLFGYDTEDNDWGPFY